MRDCSSSWQAEKIATIVKAANIKVESYWPALFAKLLEKRNVEDLILSVGSGMHPPPFASRYYSRGLECVDSSRCIETFFLSPNHVTLSVLEIQLD
jgi:hypothetical protein